MYGEIKESYICTNLNCGFNREFSNKQFWNKEEMERIVDDISQHPKFKKCSKIGCGKSIKQEIIITIFND